MKNRLSFEQVKALRYSHSLEHSSHFQRPNSIVFIFPFLSQNTHGIIRVEKFQQRVVPVEGFRETLTSCFQENCLMMAAAIEQSHFSHNQHIFDFMIRLQTAAKISVSYECSFLQFRSAHFAGMDLIWVMGFSSEDDLLRWLSDDTLTCEIPLLARHRIAYGSILGWLVFDDQQLVHDISFGLLQHTHRDLNLWQDWLISYRKKNVKGTTLMPWVTGDTKIGWEEIHCFSDDGSVVMGVLFKRKRATLESEEQLNIYRRAIDASCNGIIITDASLPDMPIVYCNPTFEKMTGYYQADILGRNCRFLQGIDVKQSAIEHIREAIKHQQSINVILRNYRSDGSMFWNDLHLSPIFDTQGALTHYVGVQSDVTRRVQSEQAIKLNDHKFKMAQTLARVGHFEWSWQDRCLNVSEMMADFIHLRTAKIDCVPWKVFLKNITSEDRIFLYQALRLIVHHHKDIEWDYRQQQINGEGYQYFHCILSCPANDSKDRPSIVFGAVRDMTEQKKMESVLKAIPKNILAAQEKEKKRIAGDVHDDLGQVLISLKMLVDSHRDIFCSMDEQQKHFFQRMHQQIDQSLFKVRRISQDLMPPEIHSYGLIGAIQDMVEMMELDRHFHFKLDVHQIRDDIVMKEALHVYRFVQEALTNVIKHSQAHKVSVIFDKDNDHMVVVIRDDGIGISNQYLDDLWQHGQSVGFRSMQQRADILEGRCSIVSHLGEGTEVMLRIPI